MLLNHGMCLVSVVLAEDGELLVAPSITFQVGRVGTHGLARHVAGADGGHEPGRVREAPRGCRHHGRRAAWRGGIEGVQVRETVERIAKPDRDAETLRRDIRMVHVRRSGLHPSHTQAVHRLTRGLYGKTPTVEVHVIRVPKP